MLGAGGHGRVVHDVIKLVKPDWQIQWHDDAWETMEPVLPVSAIESADILFRTAEALSCFVAIGSCQLRLQLLQRLLSHGNLAPALVHPMAWVSPSATLGRGSIVMAGAVVQSGTLLGDGVIVNTSASVDHDCWLADGVHVAPGARLAGGVSVGEVSMIGIGAVVRERISVGSGSVVGAGGVVVKDVPAGQLQVGNPAALLRGI